MNFKVDSQGSQSIDAPMLLLKLPGKRTLSYSWNGHCKASEAELSASNGIASIPVPEVTTNLVLALWFKGPKGKQAGRCHLVPLAVNRILQLDPVYSSPPGDPDDPNRALKWGTWIANNGVDPLSSDQSACNTDSMNPEACLHAGQPCCV
jgi:hypothetical protein